MNKENFDQYLVNTPLCDCSHSAIQKVVSEIVAPNMNVHEKAKTIFYWVRDNIKYAVMGGGYATKASKVLKIGYGDCGTKTNAHIALLRAAKIPARMHAGMADASVLEKILPKWMYKMATKKDCRDYHFWTECYINDRWIACDGLIDERLYENGIKEGIFSKDKIPTNDWNGRDDFSPLKPWILEDFGFKPSWDEWSKIYAKFFAPGLPVFILDLFTKLSSPMCRKVTDRIRKKYST